MRFFKILLLCLLFAPLSCVPPQEKSSLLNPPSKGKAKDEKEDRRGDLGDSDRRESEIRRLKSSDRVIQAELDGRFDGGYSYEDYDGAECEDSESCQAICRSLLSSSNRKACYRAPRALVENLEDGLYTLLNISEVNSVDVTPGLMAGILDIDVDIMTELVEEEMSEGDLKSFLAWVAVNHGIAEVFLEEDRRSTVMKEAFERLGELQEDVDNDVETGLNTGLIQDEDTFLHLSAVEDNEAAFKIGYKILDSKCRGRECKLDLLCARELRTRINSRYFRYDSTLVDCRTSASQGRRVRREAMCYLHGASSWSYLDVLIEEEEIRDRDFEGEDNQITVDVCNDHCGDKNSGKCKKIR